MADSFVDYLSGVPKAPRDWFAPGTAVPSGPPRSLTDFPLDYGPSTIDFPLQFGPPRSLTDIPLIFGGPGDSGGGGLVLGGMGGLPAQALTLGQNFLNEKGWGKAGKAFQAEKAKKAEAAAQATANASQPGTQPTGGAPASTGARAQPTGSQAQFFQQIAPWAQQAAAETGMPAEFLMAIAANETGSGQSVYGNNYMGIKATGNEPQTGPLGTWESAGGQRVNTQASFRAYSDPVASFRDFGQFLRENRRYAPALQQYADTGDPVQFIRNVHAAGYATDPNWANQVIALAERARGAAAAPPAAPATLGADTLAAPGGAASPFGGTPFDIRFGFNQRYGAAQFSANVPVHRGIDIVPRGGSIGTPITAVRGGTVTYSAYDPNGGNGVMIQEPNGMYNAYFHLNAPGIARGTVVQPGQVIGQMGQSGSEGFPHLHLEVRRRENGDPVDQLIDPVAYFQLGGQ